MISIQILISIMNGPGFDILLNRHVWYIDQDFYDRGQSCCSSLTKENFHFLDLKINKNNKIRLVIYILSEIELLTHFRTKIPFKFVMVIANHTNNHQISYMSINFANTPI